MYIDYKTVYLKNLLRNTFDSPIYSVYVIFVVEMREVHEIRIGKNYKDFERWPEETKRIENLRCFIVFYGSEFKIKSLSIAGKFFLLKVRKLIYLEITCYKFNFRVGRRGGHIRHIPPITGHPYIA